MARWRRAATTIVDHTYTYDGVGNLTCIDDALNLDDKTLGYDSLDRLTSANLAAGQAQSYTYDANGNRTNATINAELITQKFPWILEQN